MIIKADVVIQCSLHVSSTSKRGAAYKLAPLKVTKNVDMPVVLGGATIATPNVTYQVLNAVNSPTACLIVIC